MRVAFVPGELTSTGEFYGAQPARLLRRAGWDAACDLRHPPDLGLTRTRRGLVPRDRRFRNRDLVVLIRPADLRLRDFVGAVGRQAMIVHLVDDWLVGEGHRLDAYGGSAEVRAVLATYRRADAFVVSTPRLAEDLATYDRPTFVQRILLWDEIWRGVTPRQPDGTVRIGWSGLGSSRAADLAAVGPALRRVLDDHPEARFLAVGDEATLELLGVAGHPQASRRPLAPWREYPQVVADLDIGLAPLAPTEVNRAKTDIKVLEYSAAGVAPVCSEFQPEYRRFVADGESGMLVSGPDQWEDALRALLEDDSLRERVRRRARDAAAARFASVAGRTTVLGVYSDVAASRPGLRSVS